MATHFPSEIGLNNGTRVLLRRLTELDGNALYDFFQRLPLGLRRLAWDDLDDRDLVVRGKLQQPLPILAGHDGPRPVLVAGDLVDEFRVRPSNCVCWHTPRSIPGIGRATGARTAPARTGPRVR